MVYLSDKVSGSVDMTMRRCTSESESQLKKTCIDCGTSKTPLWRSGPDGPKSLCNACGIKSRKKRMPSSSITKENKKTKNEFTNERKSSDKSSENDECKYSSDKDEETDRHEMELVLNGEVQGAISNDEIDSPRCDFEEEVQAAILLLALSYGYGIPS